MGSGLRTHIFVFGGMENSERDLFHLCGRRSPELLALILTQR